MKRVLMTPSDLVLVFVKIVAKLSDFKAEKGFKAIQNVFFFLLFWSNCKLEMTLYFVTNIAKLAEKYK